MKKIIFCVRKRLLPAGILAASCMLALSGCGEEKKTEEKTENTGFSPTMDADATAEIRVQGSWSNFEALEAAAADWNEIYPNVTVSYNKADAYYDQLDRIVSGENVPEIVMFDTDADYANKDTVADYLVDLSEIGLNTDLFDSGMLDTFYYNDKMTSLNWGMRIPGFVVNKTLLTELDLEIPKTQEDFQQVCDTLVEKGYTHRMSTILLCRMTGITILRRRKIRKHCMKVSTMKIRIAVHISRMNFLQCWIW